MGNIFFLRLQTIPAIAAYLRHLEEAYEHQKNRNRLFKLTFDVAEFWLLLAKFAISPICAKFEAKVFNFDDFACKCFDHLHHCSPLISSPLVQIPQLSCQCLLSRVQDLRSLSFSFPLPLPGSVSNYYSSVSQNWRRLVEISRRRNADIIALPKRLVISTYSLVAGYLCVPEGVWFGIVSNLVNSLPQSFNEGPYKDLVRIFPWLHKADIVIGYVPIHPDDLDRMWQNRLSLCRSATCRPYAAR